MRIGIVIGRIGGVDGVALETEKWVEVLSKMGHEIFFMSGEYEERFRNPEGETLLPVLSFHSPECLWEQDKAFFCPDDNPGPLMNHLKKTSEFIAKHIERWIIDNKLDLLIAQNACALPCHLSMGMGLKKAIEATGIKTITHDHDFYWERGDRYKSAHEQINYLVEECFPIKTKGIKHVVINSYSGRELKKRFGWESTYVPNVMDFKVDFGVKDDYNQTLLKDIGITSEFSPLFQITRIVERKGIETAIELISKLDERNVKLVITGNTRDDDENHYYHKLLDCIHRFDVQDQVVFGDVKIHNHRDFTRGKSKIYSLSDAYAYARACTYFSTYEGFGNAFVEAVVAKVPVFVNNYKPVFQEDIGSLGFNVVMLEENRLTDEVISQMKEIIYDDKLNREIGEYNFELGKKHFSFELLQQKLKVLLN